MNKTASTLAAARSWRDIPQEVAPRSMSREGRTRLVLGFVKAGLVLVVIATVVWAAWELMQTWQTNPTKLAAPVKSEPLRKVKLTTNGVLDEAWVVHRLALPRGVTLMELDLGLLQDALLADRQIRTATLTRKFPDTLMVVLQERSPVCRLRVQDREAASRDYLISRDGMVFVGANFDADLIGGLPWLDGVKLSPIRGGGFNAVSGMETLADLLETAQVNVPGLYRSWRIVSMDRFASYGEIIVRSENVPEIVFGLRDDFFTQIALLDAVLAETQSKPVSSINLALGKKQVPVVFTPAEPVSPAAGTPARRQDSASCGMDIGRNRRVLAARPLVPSLLSNLLNHGKRHVISRTKYIGAVEIGTAKVSVLIGEVTNNRSLSIVGMGECASRGVIKGSVFDYKAASDSAHSALIDAERRAGVRVDEVYLAQTGGHLDGFSSDASVQVSAANNMVSDFDIDTVCTTARSKQLPEGRMVVQRLRRPFRLDGRLVPDPDSLVGRELQVSYFVVHGQENRIADNIHVIRGFNVRVSELILSSLASGAMVTAPDERQHGVLVLDIGAGTTDYVLYRDGMPQVAGVVPVGGSHLTNDLALGLRLTEGQADKLKLRCGRATVLTKSREEKVWLNGDFAIGDRQFPKLTIEQITSARVWELLEVVKKKLGPAFEPDRTGAGVVLTGGTAKLPGIAEAAGKIFGLSAHVSEAPAWVSENLRDPSYSTVLGLLHYGLISRPEVPTAARRSPGLFKKLFASA